MSVVRGRRMQSAGATRHNYIVEVAIEGEPDPVTGMILDLKRLKDVLEERVLSAHRSPNCR